MAKLFQVGLLYANETAERIGHMACTLGGVNYESRGGVGCLKGSAARGAAHRLFRHRYRLELSDHQAGLAKAYADRCVGLPYVWGGVPDNGHGGDCSGYQCGIYCTAFGRPVERLFATGSWTAFSAAHGFGSDDGGSPVADPGAVDRPYPGYPVARGSAKAGHVRWVQARLNYAAHEHHTVLGGKALAVDGEFGPLTFAVVQAFQRAHGLQGLGHVGPKTWQLLNSVR